VPLSGLLLGFIRYSKKKGTVELTNFNAKLKREALDMGCTTKRRKSHLAGTHGEGFKVASLVMIRNGYQARFETSSYYWNFRFGGNNQAQLYCYLRPISKAKLDHQMVAYKKSVDRGTARTLKANIWEDVSVKIGRVYNSKGALRSVSRNSKIG
jgi:hypothetical protein